MKVKITLIVLLTIFSFFSSSNMLHLDHWDVGENVVNYSRFISRLDSSNVLYVPFYGEKAIHYDLNLIYRITWKLIFDRDVQVIIHLMDESASSVLEKQFKFLNFPETYNKTEGIDYVVLPYSCMNEESLLNFYSNIKITIPRDINNHDVYSIPLMENVTSFHDIDWYLGGDIRTAVNFLSDIYDVKLLCTGPYSEIQPKIGAYYHPINGPVYGYCTGLEQAKEFWAETGLFYMIPYIDFRVSFLIWGIISTVVVLLLNQVYPLEAISKKFDIKIVKHYDVMKPEPEKR